MKNLKSILYLIPILVAFQLSSCSVDESDLVINATKSDRHVHMTGGVYLQVPHFYKRAKSYEGYQAPGYESSISTKIIYRKFDKVFPNTDVKALRKKRNILKENRNVVINGNRRGRFISMKDKRKGTTKYQLLVEDGDQTIEVKSFYMTSLRSKYEDIVRDCIMSFCLGEKIKKEAYMKLVNLDKDGSLVYTKDQKYPTLSKDNFVLKQKQIKNIQAIIPEKLISDELFQLIGVENEDYAVSYLDDGKVYIKSGSRNHKKAFVYLLVDFTNNEGILITCSGNSDFDIKKEMEEVDKHFFEVDYQLQ